MAKEEGEGEERREREFPLLGSEEIPGLDLRHGNLGKRETDGMEWNETNPSINGLL